MKGAYKDLATTFRTGGIRPPLSIILRERFGISQSDANRLRDVLRKRGVTPHQIRTLQIPRDKIPARYRGKTQVTRKLRKLMDVQEPEQTVSVNLKRVGEATGVKSVKGQDILVRTEDRPSFGAVREQRRALDSPTFSAPIRERARMLEPKLTPVGDDKKRVTVALPSGEAERIQSFFGEFGLTKAEDVFKGVKEEKLEVVQRDGGLRITQERPGVTKTREPGTGKRPGIPELEKTFFGITDAIERRGEEFSDIFRGEERLETFTKGGEAIQATPIGRTLDKVGGFFGVVGTSVAAGVTGFVEPALFALSDPQPKGIPEHATVEEFRAIKEKRKEEKTTGVSQFGMLAAPLPEVLHLPPSFAVRTPRIKAASEVTKIKIKPKTKLPPVFEGGFQPRGKGLGLVTEGALQRQVKPTELLTKRELFTKIQLETSPELKISLMERLNRLIEPEKPGVKVKTFEDFPRLRETFLEDAGQLTVSGERVKFLEPPKVAEPKPSTDIVFELTGDKRGFRPKPPPKEPPVSTSPRGGFEKVDMLQRLIEAEPKGEVFELAKLNLKAELEGGFFVKDAGKTTVQSQLVKPERVSRADFFEQIRLEPKPEARAKLSKELTNLIDPRPKEPKLSLNEALKRSFIEERLEEASFKPFLERQEFLKLTQAELREARTRTLFKGVLEEGKQATFDLTPTIFRAPPRLPPGELVQTRLVFAKPPPEPRKLLTFDTFESLRVGKKGQAKSPADILTEAFQKGKFEKDSPFSSLGEIAGGRKKRFRVEFETGEIKPVTPILERTPGEFFGIQEIPRATITPGKAPTTQGATVIGREATSFVPLSLSVGRRETLGLGEGTGAFLELSGRIDLAQPQRIKQETDLSLKSAQALAQESATAQKSALDTAFDSSFAFDTSTVQRQQEVLQDITPIQDIGRIVEPRRTTRTGFDRPPPPIPIVPPPPPLDFRLPFPGGRRKVDSFNVLVRESRPKGKGSKAFFKVNKEPLPKNKALNLGADIVDNSSARTFKIVRAKKATRKTDDAGFNRVAKFRSPKGKTRLPSGSYVEKSKHLIDSPGEKRGITAKGLIALRRKAKTPGLLNNKEIFSGVKGLVDKGSSLRSIRRMLR